MLDQYEKEQEQENPVKNPGLTTPLTNFDYSDSEAPDYDRTIKVFSEGDIVAGTVVKVDKDEVLLDIGYKSEGVIPARELSIRYGVKAEEVVKVGDQIDALVLQKEDKEGRLILSKKRAQYERSWGVLEKCMLENQPVEGEVIEVVKGGLILDIGLRGFLPASLIDVHRVKDLHSFLGTKLTCKIIEMDRNRNNVVLSRRAYLEEAASERRKILLDNLEKGMRVSGKVSSLVSFGAFVNLGGIDGLIHISELSWCHVEKPSEVLSVGDEVEVEILDVDKERERISLSLKACQEDPWEKLSREVRIGETVRGRVTKLVPFGAFVELRPGIEGLVHISELSNRHVEKPEEVLEVNQEIEVKIIDIDIDRRRISLSLRQAAGEGRGAKQTGEPEAEEIVETPEEAAEETAEPVSATVEEELLEEGEAGEAEAEASKGRELEVSGERAEHAVEPEAAEPAMELETVEASVEEGEKGAAEAVEYSEEKAAEPETPTEEGEPGESTEYGEGTLESIIEDMKRGNR
ncbi:MAG: 30S ribosomal protein S1 [Actinobacteria bacterium]|nr:30S ribosomal protein S1 [Actinomycetota bacterium]